MKLATNQSGYSMVEVLVAIAILLLATVGPMSIAARSLQYAQFTNEQNQAFFLAQEGIEAVYKMRADYVLIYIDRYPSGLTSWSWITNTRLAPCYTNSGCGIDWRDDTMFSNISDCSSSATACTLRFSESRPRARYTNYGTAPYMTPFTRVVTIEDIDPETVLVTSEVTWTASGSRQPRSVSLQTYMHDIYEID